MEIFVNTHKKVNNIRFDYLYRDAGNYKWRGSLIFSNPSAQALDEIQEKIKQVLIDQEYFIPSVCNVPSVHSAPYDPELDHAWYEVEAIEETREDVTDHRSIDEFILHLSGYGNPYW